jgi:endonuclease/exonuclease/phosphatase (EEP) superfamily protein YafD
LLGDLNAVPRSRAYQRLARRLTDAHFMHYNFVRIHQTMRVTPAMAAGVSQRLWSLTDIVRVVDEWEKRR